MQLYKFAKDLFQLWDTKNFGKIKLSEILGNLYMLGFARTEESIVPFFMGFVKQCHNYKTKISEQEVYDCEIPVSEFVKLFSGDEFQQPILDALNLEVRKRRYVEEGQLKQKENARRQKELAE